MKEASSSPNYARWAITGVIAPVIVIVILRFVIAPFIWGPDVAASLGSALGGIFIIWLLFMAIAVALLKIHREKDGARKVVIIIPKNETRFWRIYLHFMVRLGVVAFLFCGYGVFHYQTAESPANIDPVLFRTWGTDFCLAMFVFLTFIVPLALTLTVFVWRWLAGIFTKTV